MFRAFKDYSDDMYEDRQRNPQHTCYQLGRYLDKSEIVTISREEYIALGEYAKELNQQKGYSDPIYVLVEIVDFFGDEQLNIHVALEKAKERKILRDKALADLKQKRIKQQAKVLEKKKAIAAQVAASKILAQKEKDEVDLARLQALAEKNGYVLIKQPDTTGDYINEEIKEIISEKLEKMHKHV